MDSRFLTYTFQWADTQQETFRLRYDPTSMELIADRTEESPHWARLDHHQCPHCPLDCSRHPFCPLAASLSGVAHRFRDILSHDEVFLTVASEERTVSQKTTAQRALCSFMGVVMSISGCPHTSYFRPMARFHLPLASEEETIYRSASMYLLAQYFRVRQGEEGDFSLAGLEGIYRNIQIVNTTLVDRLRGASKADSLTNAVILLDMFAQIMPMVISDRLEEIRSLFAPYLH